MFSTSRTLRSSFKSFRSLSTLTTPKKSLHPLVYITTIFLFGSIGYGLSSFDFDTTQDETRLRPINSLGPIQSKITSKVYLDVELPYRAIKRDELEHEINNERIIRRIIIGLYGEKCPLTVNNFLAFIKGNFSYGVDKNNKLTYKNTNFFRVLPNYLMQGGDLFYNNGRGSISIYGQTFKDENFDLKHEGAGILSMANRGKDTNSSQFFITFRTLEYLDGKHVVFGQVLNDSDNVLRRIELSGTKSGKIIDNDEIKIIGCGILPDDFDYINFDQKNFKFEKLNDNNEKINKV